MNKVTVLAAVAFMRFCALAGGGLLPEGFARELGSRSGSGVAYLAAEGAMPEGVLVTTDRALDPIFRKETSAAVPCAVKKGDLIVLTAAVRGTSASGKVSALAKFQDGTYTGALRDNLTGGEKWSWCRIKGVAPKDYAAGTMRLHFYPWTGAQQMEIRGWKLENLGQVKPSSLPPLPAAPDWPLKELKSPPPPPPPKPVALEPLTDEQYAKKRYVILKIDDVGNHNGNVNRRFAKLADYLASKKLKSSFGVIVKSIEKQPNRDYIAWLRRNATENGGYIEFWNHGWDHAMFFNCREDDDCDRTAKFHGEFATSFAHQLKHLKMSQEVFRKYTGLTMRTLGTAGNAGNDDTRKALAEVPEIKTWLFGKGRSDGDFTVFGRWLNLEHAVGKVDYNTFVRNYAKHRQKEYIVLQGHAAMWNDAMFEDVKRIVELLERDGWIFVTPYEYHQIRTGKLKPPAQRPRSAVAGSAKTVLKAGSEWIPLKASPSVKEGSALDFSAMRPTGKPAGKYGRVLCRGAHFEFADRPGEAVRFYGVNLCFSANYPEYDEAKRLAADFARIGYNVVRIHHHDGALVGGNADSVELDPVQLKRLDGLIAAMIDEGIYVTTDLFVSRPVSWKAMGIDKPGVPSKDVFKVLVPIHAGARRNFLEFSRRFLTHVNAYTGRRLADEPGFCLLALVNEGNEMNWGGKLLDGLDVYRGEWRKWLAKKAVEDPAVYGKVPDTIPENAWAWGAHTPAFTQFLREVDLKFTQEMKKFLREEIRTDVPLTNLSCWWNPLCYQTIRHEELDVVDDHFYIDHPSFIQKPWSLPSKCANANPIANEGMGITDVVVRRLLDKPFTITEYNYSGPGRFRGVGGIVTGATAALQDWDGLWRFAWAHDINSIRKPGSQPMGYFNMADDPLSLAAERASICLYLRRDLPVLKDRYEIVLPPAEMKKPDPKQTMAKAPWKWAVWYAQLGTVVADSASSKAKWSAVFPQAFAEKSEDVRRRIAGKDGELPAVAGDGHIAIDRERGTFIIMTGRTCGGFSEKGRIEAGALTADIDSSATVWASSLDDRDIAKSSRILVTHLTDLQNSGITYADDSLTVLEKWGSLPYLMRKGKAEVSLALSPGKWNVVRLDSSGAEVARVDSVFRNGTLSFAARTDIDPDNATYLYLLQRK